MDTKSRFAKQQFVVASSPGTSQRTQITDTFRAQMDDTARGERIRELRVARRLTQPAVVDRLCELGGRKPDGSPYIGLRGYQRYEEGGGIPWDKTRLLAQVLDTTEDYILRGEGERRQPRSGRSIDSDLAARLANIEERLDLAKPVSVSRVEGDLERRLRHIEQRLTDLHDQQSAVVAVLARIDDALEREHELRRATEEAVRRLEALQGDVQPPAEHPSKTAT